MSKVHEALRRAERERANSASRPPDSMSRPPEPDPDSMSRPATPEPATVMPRPAEPNSAPRPPAPEPATEMSRPAEPSTGTRPATRHPDPRPRSPHVPLPERSAPAPDLRLDDALVAFTKPRSLAAEQYRAIRQQLSSYGREVDIRTIVVTSPLAGEGKTTTASNLAIALGQDLGRRVCLVDCDLRNPRVGPLFGITAGDGLADVLRRRASLEAALVPTPVNDLWVLAAGHLPPNPAELLGSAAMREVVDLLEARFDLVVLDTPPVVPVPDPAILAGFADGVVVVLQAGHTPKRLLDRALDRLHGAVLLGFVLNKTEEFRYYANYYQYDYGA